jgi:hypothetical protein
VPEPPIIVPGESVQTRFVELEATESVTVPVKLFNDAMVMVELPTAPTLTVRVA